MKKMMKKTVVVWLSLVMLVALTACGSGEDTKETVQNTVDELQAKMTEAMSGYQNVFSNTEALKDPSQAGAMIDKAIEMIDAGMEACDSVDAPGPDSQKYRDTCKKMFQLLKDMMTDMKNIDTSDSNAASEISTKYLGQLMSMATEAATMVQDLVNKYGITMPATTPSVQ